MYISHEVVNTFNQCLWEELCLFGKPSIKFTRTCWAELRLKSGGALQYQITYEYLNNHGLTVKLKGHTILIRTKDIKTYVNLKRLEGKKYE